MRKIVFLIIIIFICVNILSFDVFADGSDDNITWEYNNETKTITFSGKGELGYHKKYSMQPAKEWECYKNIIEHVVVMDGIEAIGYNAFTGYSELQTVELADSVLTIKAYAFASCSNLYSVNLGKNLQVIEEGVFINCSNLNDIILPKSLQSLGASFDNLRCRNREFYICFYCDSNVVKLCTQNGYYNTKKIHDYDIKKYDYREPTCSRSGIVEYYQCEYCNNIFYDEKGTKPMNLNAVSIPKNDNHLWSEWIVIKEPTNSSEGLKQRVCLYNPNHLQSEIIPKENNNIRQKDVDNNNNYEINKNHTDDYTKNKESINNHKYSNEWVNGKWYNADSTQTYSGTLTWKSNSTGWWVEDSAGWYPQSQWQKIDGVWYYFKPDGYMASAEYYGGYWFNSDGSWDDQYELSWKSNSTGWWVEDKSGWWPSSKWLKIDGSWYYFNASGYMVTNQYVDGYWLGSDGACW